MPATFNWIYLGQTTTFIDEQEGNADAERASFLNNTTWGTTAAPLHQRVVSVTTINNGGTSGVLDTNNTVVNDQYSTNVGNGVQTLTHDASSVYTLNITYVDGTTAVTTATVAQSTGGHLFLAPPVSTVNPILNAKPIATIRLSGATNNTGVNFTADRSVNGWDNGAITGTAGNDLINGSYVEPVANGSDVIDGGDGLTGPGTGYNDDVVLAGAGNDTVLSGLGNDSVLGEAGNDSLDGGAGDDTLDGGIGLDTLLGGTGTDVLLGGADADSLIGGAGGDSVSGGDGADRLFGDDTLGTDTLGGADTIDAGAGDDFVRAGVGNDTVTGGTGADSILGDAGNDVLHGDDSLGADTLGGNDTIDGGIGADVVLGGFGNDSLAGGTGNDTVDGGAGNDVIGGGALSGTTFTDDNLADTLTGGEGFDRFIAGNGDLISDFGVGGGSADDGDPGNNDSVDLSGYYNAANLATINAARVAAGQQPYATALGWMRADQADGTLNDISTANGFGADFSLRIQNGGSAVSGSALTADNVAVVCFADDVLIDTARGPVAAGDLKVGDLVMTRDHGPQPIRWMGKRHLDAAGLAAAPHLRPIRIGKDALGPDRPQADLVVSPQHRILVRSRIAQKMFGTDEVLVAAKQLCQIDGIDQACDLDGVTYVHFLFDAHQIVMSNGAETESLHPGTEAMKSVGPAAREEIFAIFPELRDGTERPAARPLTSGRMGRKLAVRHHQNGKPLVA